MDHEHTRACVEYDYEDYTDASGGEVWEYYRCIVTGETHTNLAEFNLDD